MYSHIYIYSHLYTYIYIIITIIIIIVCNSNFTKHISLRPTLSSYVWGWSDIRSVALQQGITLCAPSLPAEALLPTTEVAMGGWWLDDGWMMGVSMWMGEHLGLWVMIIWMVGWVSIWCFYIILNVFVLIFDHCWRNFSRDRTQRVSHKDVFCCLNIGAKVGEFERQPLCIFCWNFVVNCHCHPNFAKAQVPVSVPSEARRHRGWEPDHTGESHIPSWFLDFVWFLRHQHLAFQCFSWIVDMSTEDIAGHLDPRWIQDHLRPPGRWEARVWQVAGGSRVGDRAGNQRTGRPIATSVLLVER